MANDAGEKLIQELRELIGWVVWPYLVADSEVARLEQMNSIQNRIMFAIERFLPIIKARAALEEHESYCDLCLREKHYQVHDYARCAHAAELRAIIEGGKS